MVLRPAAGMIFAPDQPIRKAISFAQISPKPSMIPLTKGRRKLMAADLRKASKVGWRYQGTYGWRAKSELEVVREVMDALLLLWIGGVREGEGMLKEDKEEERLGRLSESMVCERE